MKCTLVQKKKFLIVSYISCLVLKNRIFSFIVKPSEVDDPFNAAIK